jgi:hypothetical protein
MNLIRGIAWNSVIVLLPAAGLSLLLHRENLPLSILIGGILGILNLRALSWSIRGIIGTAYPNAKALFFSQFRFVILALIIVLLAYSGFVDIIGIMAGFTVVFVQVLVQSARHAGKHNP